MTQNICSLFKSSAKNCKSLRAITITAMFIALNLVLDRVSIQLTPELRIGVGFLTSAMIAMMFGPVMGISAGFVTEILSYVLYPRGAYFPGFTLTAMVGGLIYGLVLYQKEIRMFRAFAAKGLVNLLCNIGLNTLWLSMLQGQAVFVLLPARLLKNVILWPLESLLLFLVARAVMAIYQRMAER